MRDTQVHPLTFQAICLPMALENPVPFTRIIWRNSHEEISLPRRCRHRARYSGL